jgi:Amt family ammonium transporter
VNAGLGNDAAGKPIPLGWVDGHGQQVLNQAEGAGIAWGLAIVGTLVILKVVDLLLGIRVSADQEVEGLDLSMHGEEGYNLDT